MIKRTSTLYSLSERGLSMKRYVAFLVAMIFCFATSSNGFAATAKIDATILQQLNTVNFSNPIYDQKPETKKWLDAVYTEDSGENDLYWLYNGHTYQDDFVQDLKMVVKRTVSQGWKVDGKVDKTLGQAYVSKVNLTIGELEWYYSTVTVKAWVKKVSGVNKITKVTYNLEVKYSPHDSDAKFMEANKGITYKNSYLYTKRMLEEAKAYKEPSFTTASGMLVTPDPSVGFMSDGGFYGQSNVANYQKGSYITLGEIVPKSDEWVNVDGYVYGLSDDAEFDIVFVDKATGKVAPKDQNYLLQSGKTYLVQFKTEDGFSKYFENQLFYALFFVVKE